MCGELAVDQGTITRLRGPLGLKLEFDPRAARQDLAHSKGVPWTAQEDLLWENREEIAVALGWEPGQAESLKQDPDTEDAVTQFTTIGCISRRKISLVHYKESTRGVLYRVWEDRRGVKLDPEEAERRGQHGIVFSVWSERESWCRCGSRHSFGCPFRAYDVSSRRTQVAHDPVIADAPKVALKSKLTKKEIARAKMMALSKLPGM